MYGCVGRFTRRVPGSSLNPGHTVSVGTPSVANIFPSWSISVLPVNSGSEANSSAMIHPSDQTSIAGPYFGAPSKSSGARYHSVTTVGVYVPSGSP